MPDIQKSSLLQEFKAFYQEANSSNLERMDRIYTQDIEFRDPLHTVLGILALKSYMKNLYANSNCVEFEYTDEQRGENSATIAWYMKFSHSGLAGGKMIKLRGITQIRFTDRIYYQEDFYDLGAMLYQHIPVLGAIVRFVNKRVRP
tara:strand:- start:283 stop:720 length:438 start_codon:yes stop_codon:yes gene_type:complete